MSGRVNTNMKKIKTNEVLHAHASLYNYMCIKFYARVIIHKLLELSYLFGDVQFVIYQFVNAFLTHKTRVEVFL